VVTERFTWFHRSFGLRFDWNPYITLDKFIPMISHEVDIQSTKHIQGILIAGDIIGQIISAITCEIKGAAYAKSSTLRD
jgi:hypothetical protein